MNVLIFGATGMGRGVLRECLLAGDVTRVQAIGRTATAQSHPKLKDLVHQNMFDYSTIEADLADLDACFFCIGLTSSGMTEAQYARLTYELTLCAAQTLARLNPQMTFVYVSGAGADSSEVGKVIWARVRGLMPQTVLSTEIMGRAMLVVARHGAPKEVLEAADISELGRREAA